MPVTYHFNLMGMVVIAVSVACLFLQRKRFVPFWFHQNASIVALLASTSLANVFDFISVIMIGNPGQDETYYAATYIFLTLSLLFTTLAPYFFVVRLFDETHGKRIVKILLAIPPAALMFAAIAFNRQSGIFFTLDRDTLNVKYGPYIKIFNVLFMAYLLIAAVEAYRKRRYISEMRRKVLFLVIAFLFITLVADLRTATTYMSGAVAGNLGIATGILVLVFYCIDRADGLLTGLKNESGFTDAANWMLDTSSDDDLVLEIINIYHLQMVNERFGYKAGDALLAELGKRLAEKYHGVPSALGRLIGGDSFAVLVHKRDFKSVKHQISLAELLHADKYGGYTVTLYCGVCPVNDKNFTVRKLLRRARYALATVYGSFQNHVAWFDGDIEKRYEDERTIEQKINTAIDMTDFHVVLQPIVDTQTEKVCSAEALVRWHDKELGVVPPDRFIPTFEKTGFSARLDRHMLESVCRLIADMKSRGVTPVPISVNVSRADIENETLADEIAAIVDGRGIEHSLIKIEITESAFNDKDTVLKNIVNRLRGAGFLVLMDDFGSGYSNFAMFQRASCDIVKLDMKFLYGVGDSDKSNAVLKAIVRLTKDLRLPTVVEGVETKEQYEFVKSLGCDMIQGYYFSKPLPYEDFVKRLD